MLDLGECKFSTLAKCWTPPSFASFQNPLYEAQAYHTLQRRFERFCGSAKQSINGAPPYSAPLEPHVGKPVIPLKVQFSAGFEW